jgi:hypothetical protein
MKNVRESFEGMKRSLLDVNAWLQMKSCPGVRAPTTFTF